MANDAVLVRKEGAVALITINRPEKRNCISEGVLEGLHSAFDELGADPDIKVIVTTGAGDVAWMAGFDGNYLKKMVEGEADPDRCPQLYYKIRKSPKIAIAAVNGYCLGGAISIVISHDLVVASDNAKFGLPEVFRGFVPRYAVGPICEAVPKNLAMEMTITGANWDAYRAERFGLANMVVPHAQLMEKAMAFANDIARWDGKTLAYCKKAVYQVTDQLTFEQRINVCQFIADEATLHSDAEIKAGINDLASGKGLKATF